MQHSKSSFFQKRGRNGIQPSNQATKQPSNQATKQRYHVFITIFITFTKDRLKIPYFLLFPLLFPLALTRTAIFLKNLIP
ncbi:hypothetical protein D2C87_06380 [Helicobacter pylori]|nr:hypothetical protein D2C87_00250 [Helicobacter pylori]QEF21861.1 hypothetical protein D2C87_06380 [Helicobacter pylori]